MGGWLAGSMSTVAMRNGGSLLPNLDTSDIHDHKHERTHAHTRTSPQPHNICKTYTTPIHNAHNTNNRHGTYAAYFAFCWFSFPGSYVVTRQLTRVVCQLPVTILMNLVGSLPLRVLVYARSNKYSYSTIVVGTSDIDQPTPPMQPAI